MIGKFISFGLGVATGIWIAPKLGAIQAQYDEVVGHAQEFFPAQPAPTDEVTVVEVAPVTAPAEVAEIPYEEPIEVAAIEPEDTTEFDAGVEAFLHASANALEGTVV